MNTLHPASVSDGILQAWGGNYKALVDAGNGDTVIGLAFEVLNAEHHEALRTYETSQHELVRCSIKFDDGHTTPGLALGYTKAMLLS